METSKRRNASIVFVKTGAFSGTNPRVEQILRSYFPEYTLHVLEVKALLRKAPFALIAIALATFLPHPLRLFDRRRSLRNNLHHYLWRSAFSFALISRLIKRAINLHYPEATFILQTQSLWSSAVPGKPFYIYTDSVALTNLYYRSFLLQDLPSGAWLQKEQEAFSTARRIFVWSNHVRRSLLDLYHISPEKVVNVRAGSNLPNLPHVPSPVPAVNKTILFVGVEWLRKGGPELVEGFRMLPPRHKDAQLLIAGCSPSVDVPGCKVLGRLPLAQMGELYKQAAIFCMPTHIEPFGIVFIEAMIHSVATVAPDHGAMPDYIVHQKTGMLHRPGDSQSIADCLTWLLDHPEHRRAIAKAGFHAVKDIYNWESVGESLRKHIDADLR